MGETQEIQTGTLTVPDLVGQELEFAASILDEMGIPYTVDTNTQGSVVSAQSLAKGTVYDGSQELVLALAEVNLGRGPDGGCPRFEWAFDSKCQRTFNRSGT